MPNNKKLSDLWKRKDDYIASRLDWLKKKVDRSQQILLNDLTSEFVGEFATDDAGNLAESGEHTFTTLPGETAFTSSRLSVSPGAVYVGDTVTISVLVTNNGEAAGSYTVRLEIDGMIEESRDLTLNAGASEEVTFTTTKNMAGTYSVKVGGLSGSFIVEEQPEEPAPPPDVPVEPTINWPIIWGTMAGVLVVGVIILWLAIRRRAY